MVEFKQSVAEANNARITLADHLKQVLEQAEATKRVH